MRSTPLVAVRQEPSIDGRMPSGHAMYAMSRRPSRLTSSWTSVVHRLSAAVEPSIAYWYAMIERTRKTQADDC